MTENDINPYGDNVSEAGVTAAVAERAAIAENGAEAIEVGDGRTVYRLLHRDGPRVIETFLDPDEYGDVPRYKRGTVELLTVPSLVEYVRRYQGAGTAVYADPNAGRFEALIDDHLPQGAAGWASHRATCTLQQHRDYVHWASLDGRLVSQLDFAEHVEQGLHNIVEPAAADLLEVAQTLTGSRNVAWKSAQRLSDGQVGFRYEEQLDGRAGPAGTLEIPQSFTLRFPPFEGSPAIDVSAAFRWRLNDGRVQLGYRLLQIKESVRAVVDSLIDDVERELELRVLLGRARSAGTRR